MEPHQTEVDINVDTHFEDNFRVCKLPIAHPGSPGLVTGL